MRYIENPGRVRAVYSDIFSDIQGHSAIFNHVQGHWGTLRHTVAYSVTFKNTTVPYSEFWWHF